MTQELSTKIEKYYRVLGVYRHLFNNVSQPYFNVTDSEETYRYFGQMGQWLTVTATELFESGFNPYA